MTSKAFFVCLFLVLPLSCASTGKEKKTQEGFIHAVERFNRDVRWEDYKSASLWLAPALQEDFWALTDRLQAQLHIMDTQVRSISLDEGRLSGTVLVRYRTWSTADPNVETKLLRQKWQYSENVNLWQVVQHDLSSLMAPEEP